MTKKKIANDPINPQHYAKFGAYSAVHVIEAWGLGYHLGNTVKYIQRAGGKPGASELQDLLKAKWYLERYIHTLDPSQPDPAA